MADFMVAAGWLMIGIAAAHCLRRKRGESWLPETPKPEPILKDAFDRRLREVRARLLHAFTAIYHRQSAPANGR